MFFKKKGFQKIFSDDKDLQIFFSGDFHLRKTNKGLRKAYCEVSGAFQQNFNGSKHSAVLEPRTGAILEDLRPRLRPRTSKCVLEDSISVTYVWYTLLTFFFG